MGQEYIIRTDFYFYCIGISQIFLVPQYPSTKKLAAAYKLNEIKSANLNTVSDRGNDKVFIIKVRLYTCW